MHPKKNMYPTIMDVWSPHDKKPFTPQFAGRSNK